MHALHHAVRLRMVWRGVDSVGAGDAGERGEKPRLELCPLVRRDGQRRAKGAYPVLEECSGDGVCLLIGQRNGFWPPGKSVDYCQTVLESCLERQLD